MTTATATCPCLPLVESSPAALDLCDSAPSPAPGPTAQTAPNQTDAPVVPVVGAARSSTWMSGLRAGVLGANDGVVSIAGVLVGVAGAAASHATLTTAGVVALVAGAASMAAGEYVSVAAQRDAESAGRAEHDDDELTNPWVAAGVSAVSFTLGALLPLLMMLTSPAPARVGATVVAALVALAITGAVSAHLSRAGISRAVVRNMVVGGVAMAFTYGAGALFTVL